MSTRFTIVCETDNTYGPDLQRTAGGSSLIDSDAWSRFLIEHEHHELALFHGALVPRRDPAAVARHDADA